LKKGKPEKAACPFFIDANSTFSYSAGQEAILKEDRK
jgi:hypothetical protein